MDEAAVHNQIGGTVVGAVVQAGTIDQVVLYQQPQVGVAPVPRQLPAVVRDFAGRDAELAALDKMLSPDSVTVEPMVVAVDGIAGVGKTSLVVWWARRVEQRFPDGTLFVNLRGYGPSAPVEAGLVLASFLQALGVAEDRVPADLDAQGALYRSLLLGRRVRVVLDNAASAEQVRPLLPAAAGCAVIVTSRAVLTGLVVLLQLAELDRGRVHRPALLRTQRHRPPHPRQAERRHRRLHPPAQRPSPPQDRLRH